MKRSRLILIITAFFLSACVSTGSGFRTYDLNEVKEDDIRTRLEENHAGIRSISGRFDFSYSTASDRKQSSGYIFLSSGDTIYIEIKGIVGETTAIMFMDKDTLIAVNYNENLTVRDKSGEDALRRVTGIDIDVSDLRNSILGRAAGKEISDIAGRDGKLKVRINSGGDMYSFVTFNEKLSVTEIDDYKEREIKLRKVYDYFTNEKGVLFPRRIRVSAFNPPSKLTIFFTDIRLNTFPEISL